MRLWNSHAVIQFWADQCTFVLDATIHVPIKHQIKKTHASFIHVSSVDKFFKNVSTETRAWFGDLFIYVKQTNKKIGFGS